MKECFYILKIDKYDLNSRKIYTYTLCVYIVNCSRITYYFEQCFAFRL